MLSAQFLIGRSLKEIILLKTMNNNQSSFGESQTEQKPIHH
jgi:hypothetical protein